ncbi:alkaline phosphatase [Gilvimarinus chinensis]|uniref:alkaline phosphatase n=1 Tax=Gilvimarinus chinensis TaxID=396005 RepID=UPI0003755016|nr:alkaline phosphatase [Gilvimarinus chinensis]
MKWFVAACMVTSCTFAQAQNIIFVIGDGMGMEYLSAYRHFQDDPTTPELEATWFDRHLQGSASTHPDDVNQVTDSAASATALAAGIKTYNGAIGVDLNKQPVETLLERAKKKGYQTAMVVTSQINHATPASFAAHIDSRNKYNEIADQYIDRRYQGKPWVDILFGGGQRYFLRDDRNLVTEFESLGYTYADTYDGVAAIQTPPALALLADKGLPFRIDSDEPRRLAFLTETALRLLDPQKPFFMLVEASQIDWCGHANDIACAMHEMRDTEETLKLLSRYVSEQPDTLVVVTADHSTGGLSMGSDGDYQWRADVVRGVKASANVITQTLLTASDWYASWQSLTSIQLDESEQAILAQARLKVLRSEAKTAKNNATTELREQVLAAIDKASVTGWTTSGHTGGDVAVMAMGVGAETFAGHKDNTDLAKMLFDRLP